MKKQTFAPFEKHLHDMRYGAYQLGDFELQTNLKLVYGGERYSL